MDNLAVSEENELKLIVSEETQAKMLASIRDMGDKDVEKILRIVKAVLDLAEFDVSQERVETILDEYYDTRDLDLFWSHGSMRVRRSLGKIVVTVKKLQELEQGQFSRSEITEEISEDVYPEFQREGFQDIVANSLPALLNRQFSLLLRVNNIRRAFSLKRRDEQYNLALDLYTFINPRTGESSEVQSEVEIEALNLFAKSKLASIRRNLVDIIKTFSYSKDSKYERGLKYFGFDKPRFIRLLLEKWNSQKGLAWIGIILGIILGIIGIITSILLSH